MRRHAAIHSDGPAVLSAATVGSLRDFAAGEGTPFRFRRRPFAKWRRLVLSLSRRLGARRAYRWLEKARRKRVRHQPEFGNVVLRWAVNVIKPRYAEVERWRN